MAGQLIQTTVDLSTLRKLDALARAQGHRRASYLRHLVELHVQALTPRLARATQTSPTLSILDQGLLDGLQVIKTADELSPATKKPSRKTSR